MTERGGVHDADVAVAAAAATSALAEALAAGEPSAAAAAAERLILAEDALLARNLLKPYQDRLPELVIRAGLREVAAMLDRLPVALVRRVLFGNYARIPDARLRALLAAMEPAAAGRLVTVMAVGLDAPREMARILAGAGGTLTPVLEQVHPTALLRLLDELPPPRQRDLGRLLGERASAGLAGLPQARGNRLVRRWLNQVLGAMPSGSASDGSRTALLRTADLDRAAGVLAESEYGEVHEAFRDLRPERAAALLQQVARTDPQAAAELLTAANRRILLRPPTITREVAEWPRDGLAARVLAACDVRDSSTRALVQALSPDDLELLLPHLPLERRTAVQGMAESAEALPFPIDVGAAATGRRRSRALDGGVRWSRITEVVDTGSGRHPVVVDLLEVALDQVRLEAGMAVDETRALPVARVAEVFEAYRASGTPPPDSLFAELGLTQLSRAVERTGAVAAINGNFYFDYGHYLNGVTLGIDMASVPGLFFGDPIGWFVGSGSELVPAAVNRASAMVLQDGSVHVDRAFLAEVRINGHVVTWDAVNEPKAPGRTVLLTSLSGYRTEPGDSHLDVACARGRVWAVAPTGGQIIPLTGFVLSLPHERASRLLPGVAPGDRVEVVTDFEQRHGPVRQAMACGPSLVRDGVLDLDFEAEHFGQQDSTVISFFLPRTVETYRAARSFLGRRGASLVLGTVSGTAYGHGPVGYSGGMTFGELAQLALDLDLELAYALDGGGSSSLVARDQGRIRLLNAPTGGADVGAGVERYINTYWLVHPR